MSGDAKNGLLKHSNSYPVLDETISNQLPADSSTSTSGNVSGKSNDVTRDNDVIEESMVMDEDYMYDTVNVSKAERGVGKTVDVDKLKKTLIGMKSRRDRQQVRTFKVKPYGPVLNRHQLCSNGGPGEM